MLFVAIAVIFVSSKSVSANPFFFPPTAQTAAATTSPAFLQAATATTSVVYYDSYYQNTLGANTKAVDAALHLRLSATSTSAVFNIVYEYSNGTPGFDCTTQPTFCEWYQDNYSHSSTAYPVNIATIENMTVISALAAGTTTKSLFLPTPTRYVRVNAKVTGAPGNVWAQIIPNKERAN